MRKLFTLLALSFIVLNIGAQKHYIFPGESSTKDFGRVIDMIEVSPGVIAFQSVLHNQEWKATNMVLSTLDLASSNTSFGDTLGFRDRWYRAGFGKLSDNSVVVSYNSNSGYEISHYSYDKTTQKLTNGSSMLAMGTSFGAISGGICPLKKGGYAVVMMYRDKASSKNDARILLLNDESKFRQPPFDYLTTVSENLILKPSLIDMFYNSRYVMSEGNYAYVMDQVAESGDGNIFAFNGQTNQTSGAQPKIWCFNNKMQLQWETDVVVTGYGYRPLSAGKADMCYLTTFTSGNNGLSTTTVQAFQKNKLMDKMVCNIDSFEANGSFVMVDQNICVYGFSTGYNPKYGDYSSKFPSYYLIDAKNMKVISSWQLGLDDQPSKDVSARYNATMIAPGKLYTGTQLADGSLVFGGHILGIVTDPVSNKAHPLYCNYVVKLTPAEWGKK